MSRYLQRLKRQPDKAKVQRWMAFLRNHREVMAAFDFFTVPTLSFRVLYCLFGHRAQIGGAFCTSTRPRIPTSRVDYAATPRGAAASMPVPLRHL